MLFFIPIYRYEYIGLITQYSGMNEQEILKRLYEHNPWWDGSRPQVPPIHRKDFYVIKREVSGKKVTAVIGPRRVGKTVLLHQLINNLIVAEKIPKKNIIYIRVDDTILKRNTGNLIQNCLETYSKNVLQKTFAEMNGKVYVFLDEIQSGKNWSETLKDYYDLDYNIKFFVSGSSSAGIKKGVSESLVGRINIFIMMPLKFSEFLRFKSPKIERQLTSISVNLREVLKESIQKGKADIIFSELERYRRALAGEENKIDALLREYLIKGGYIEVLNEKSWGRCTIELKTYVELTIYKDIMMVFGIRNPRELDELLALVSSESSQRMSEAGLSKNLKIKQETLSKYLDLLEDVFLVSSSEIYAKSRAKRIRNPKKLFINDIGIRNSLIHSLSPRILEDKKDVGKMAETIVHNHLMRLAFHLTKDPKNSCFYWKNGKDKEIDNILVWGKKAIPIEVKYQETIQKGDEKLVKEFMKEQKTEIGIIIKKNDLSLNGKVIRIPLWLFLLLV